MVVMMMMMMILAIYICIVMELLLTSYYYDIGGVFFCEVGIVWLAPLAPLASEDIFRKY